MTLTEHSARDVMSRNVITVRDDRSLAELGELLTSNEISGAPVVDATGRFVGVVSSTDFAELAGEHVKRRGDGRRADAALKVRDIMTPTVYTIPEETRVSDIARTMIAGRVHRLVVTRDGHAVGILTSLDLLKLLVKD